MYSCLQKKRIHVYIEEMCSWLLRRNVFINTLKYTRTTEEIRTGELQWPFWTKLVVVAIGFTGGLVFMYIQCKVTLQFIQVITYWSLVQEGLYVPVHGSLCGLSHMYLRYIYFKCTKRGMIRYCKVKYIHSAVKIKRSTCCSF